MIKSVDELKALILWAKEQKVQAMKVGDVQFELSTMALVEATELTADKPVAADTSTLAENEQSTPDEDEKLLYWSTR